MPRSFLIKKKEDPRMFHSYKPRDIKASDVTPESLMALTPYTPSLLPLTVRVNNGYIHDVISPSIPEDSAQPEQEKAKHDEVDHLMHEENRIMPGNYPVDRHLVERSAERHFEQNMADRNIERNIADKIIREFQKNNFSNGITIGYTYDAFFVSDGRSRNKEVPEKEKNVKHRYTCNECGKDYATSSNLSRHKQTHRSLESNLAKKCFHCGKAYVSMPALSMHMLTHDLRHKCTVCGKAFSRPWLLQGHFRSHTGEKPYGCAHCGKAFADRSNLRAHMQTHSAFKSYNCKRCNKSFALKSYLNKHYESACIKEDGSSTCSEESFAAPRGFDENF